MKIFNAIKKINPNAEVTVRGRDIDTCEIDWLNGTAEISKADIKAMLPTVETEMANAEQAAIDKKASGKQKLKELGLDDAEINALIG